MSNTPLEQNGIDLDSVLAKVNALPQAGITPTGSITLTEEKSYDVTEKATAVVDMSATRARLAEAITAKGIDTLPDSSFDAMIANVGLISGGDSFDNYTQVEYIYCKEAGCRIKTDLFFEFNKTYRIEADIEYMALSKRSMIFSNYANSSNSFAIEINTSNQIRLYQSGDIALGGTLTNVRNRFAITSVNGLVTVSNDNGELVSGQYSNFGQPYQKICLFGDYRNNGGVFNPYKIRSFKAWEDSTLIADFIPCKRKSDNELGLWDNVTEKFYVNTAAGLFADT